MDSRAYVRALTGLRGYAAFWVYLHHLAALSGVTAVKPNIGPWEINLSLFFHTGWMGVDIFFVLSGFLLALPFMQARLFGGPRPSITHYIKRRFLRIYPAYAAALLILIVFAGFFMVKTKLDAYNITAHLFFWFYEGDKPVIPMVGAWWTLPVEFGFYLALPLIALLLTPKRWWWVLFVLIIASTYYRYLEAEASLGLPMYLKVAAIQSLPTKLSEFLIGVIGAYCVCRWPQVRQVKLTSALLLIGVVWAVLYLRGIIQNILTYWEGHPLLILAPIGLSIPVLFVVLALYWQNPLGKLLFANRVMYFLGLISYSFYLWHMPITRKINAVWPDWLPDSFFVRGVVITAAVTLVSYLSYRFIEKPFIRLGKRKASRTATSQ